MNDSRTVIQPRSYALALGVALSLVLLQGQTCDRGNTDLTSLELEVDGGPNLIVGFSTDNRNYDVSTSGSTVTVRAQALFGVNDVSWQWLVGTTTIGSGPIGMGSGEVTIPIPIPDGESVLRVVVKSNQVGSTASGFYRINISDPCASLPDGEYCDNGTGNLDVCVGGVCTSDAVTKTIQMTCNSPIAYVTEYWTLTIDPSGPIVAGQPFDVTVSGAIEAEDVDDAIATFANVLLPRAFRFGSVPVEARSGATGSASPDIWNASGPYVCGSDGSPCDPANDTAGMFSVNTDCPSPSMDWCLPFTDQTIIDSSADNCGSCTEPSNPPFSGSLKNSLCMQGEIPSTPNYACTDSDPTPLVPMTATFIADPVATEVLFGFEEPFVDESFGSVFNDGIGFDAVFGVEDAPSSDPVEPGRTGSLPYSCYMGVFVSTGNPSVVDPLPDSALISIPVQGGVPGDCTADPECSDGDPCTVDICCDLPENQTVCGPLEGCQSALWSVFPIPPPACTTPSGLSGTCDVDGNCICDDTQCFDGNDCTLDLCDAVLGCDFTQGVPAGTECFDFFPVVAECDGNGVCERMGCLFDSECDLGNPCVVSSCDTQSGGICVDTPGPAGTPCDAGGGPGSGACDGGGACVDV